MDADLCLDVLFSTPPVAIATARLLTQALSNTVTSNQNLVAALWETYLSLPEDQVILMYVSRLFFFRGVPFLPELRPDETSSKLISRLLATPDVRTLLTTLIFILNCIHGSRKRT